MFIREKKTDCAEYREVDIIPRTEKAEEAARGKRGKRRKAKKPKQNALNDKNAKRYLVQLGNGNFHVGDLHTSCTYSVDNLPGTVEEAEKIVGNYLRRIAYRRQKLGLEPLKYILVTEYKFSKDGQQLKRIHHHIIMNGGMDRDEVEMMWTAQRVNWKKADSPDKAAAAAYRDSVEKMGWVNADRLQMNENGIEGLCKYIIKDPQGKKRYSSSRNLERPETKREDSKPQEAADKSLWKASRNLEEPTEKCNDFKYSKAKVEQLAKSADGGLSEFQKIYEKVGSKLFELLQIVDAYVVVSVSNALYQALMTNCQQSNQRHQALGQPPEYSEAEIEIHKSKIIDIEPQRENLLALMNEVSKYNQNEIQQLSALAREYIATKQQNAYKKCFHGKED